MNRPLETDGVPVTPETDVELARLDAAICANRVRNAERNALKRVIAERDSLRQALQHLVNELPDCVLEWAREGIGNTQVACIRKARDKARGALGKGE